MAAKKSNGKASRVTVPMRGEYWVTLHPILQMPFPEHKPDRRADAVRIHDYPGFRAGTAWLVSLRYGSVLFPLWGFSDAGRDTRPTQSGVQHSYAQTESMAESIAAHHGEAKYGGDPLPIERNRTSPIWTGGTFQPGRIPELFGPRSERISADPSGPYVLWLAEVDRLARAVYGVGGLDEMLAPRWLDHSTFLSFDDGQSPREYVDSLAEEVDMDELPSAPEKSDTEWPPLTIMIDQRTIPPNIRPPAP